MDGKLTLPDKVQHYPLAAVQTSPEIQTVQKDSREVRKNQHEKQSEEGACGVDKRRCTNLRLHKQTRDENEDVGGV